MKRHERNWPETPPTTAGTGGNFCQASSAKPPTGFHSPLNFWRLSWYYLSDDFSSPPPNKWGYFQGFSVTGIVHVIVLYSPGLRAGAELHCGIFVKINPEENQTLTNCHVTPTTTQLRGEPEGNNIQWQSKIHLKILKGKPERGKGRISIFLLR